MPVSVVCCVRKMPIGSARINAARGQGSADAAATTRVPAARFIGSCAFTSAPSYAAYELSESDHPGERVVSHALAWRSHMRAMRSF